MKQLNKYQKNNISLHSSKSMPFMLVIGIIFIAANLRSPLTAVGPVVDQIRNSLHISNTLAGMITTFPLFAFAFFSPFVPKLARKYGASLVLFWSLIFLTLGIGVRSLFGEIGLFFGTAILGLSISVGNVLVPSLIKRDFSKRVGLMTGVYNASMSLFGAIASGVSIPVAMKAGLGWEGALGIWAALSFFALILWIPQVKRGKQKTTILEDMVNRDNNARRVSVVKHGIGNINESAINEVHLWRSPLAWQVTIYTGLQSMVLYCMYAWLPNILISQGMKSGDAGWMLSLCQLSSLPMGLIGSVLAGRKSNQRAMTIVASLCVLSGLLGVFLGETRLEFIWMVLLGSGTALTFSMSLIFFNFRTQNADQAARLSGMAQSVGYLLASFGPMIFGLLHDITDNWTMPLIILIAIAGICLFVGLGASRDLLVTSSGKSRKHTL
ncbi:MFS transporter [Anaerocolumna sp. AGMB13025]|uniref:CynX/NimT family MFS transporter n=1 Tax=Anaerocolumna sp. AGMB13025 TaxID=3039116 RepID=UPI00241DA1F3|nr:MFS transporter [Anaerocolumna sp. AGMB13025]WFR59184.1 MFS transporter [Anaerocolumna sp. AGMB13025]